METEWVWIKQKDLQTWLCGISCICDRSYAAVFIIPLLVLFISWYFNTLHSWENSVSLWILNLFESKVGHWLHSSVWILNLVLSAHRRHSLKWLTCVECEKWPLLWKCIDETGHDLETFFSLLNIWVFGLKIVLFWTHLDIMFCCVYMISDESL